MSSLPDQKPYAGHLVRSYGVADLQLMESAYPASLRMPAHSHERAYISVVLQGAYTETRRSGTEVCHGSTLTFHPPHETHAVRFHDRPVRIFRLEVGPSWLERVHPFTPAFRDGAVLSGGMPSCLALRLYREFRARDAVTPLAIEGLTLELVAESGRDRSPKRETSPPVWLLQARDLLHTEPTTDLTVTQLAQQVGVHPVHLMRAFKQHFHCTVGEYVRRLRIEYACGRLVRSEDPLGRIAVEAGFADQAHFSRVFKQLTHLTPNQYRRMYRAR